MNSALPWKRPPCPTSRSAHVAPRNSSSQSVGAGHFLAEDETRLAGSRAGGKRLCANAPAAEAAAVTNAPHAMSMMVSCHVHVRNTA